MLGKETDNSRVVVWYEPEADGFGPSGTSRSSAPEAAPGQTSFATARLRRDQRLSGTRREALFVAIDRTPGFALGTDHAAADPPMASCPLRFSSSLHRRPGRGAESAYAKSPTAAVVAMATPNRHAGRRM